MELLPDTNVTKAITEAIVYINPDSMMIRMTI
jgi:hypothetical protein